MTFHVVAPIYLRSSHTRNTKGFRSDNTFTWHGGVAIGEISCLGAEFRSFSLEPQTNTQAELKFETDWFQSEEEIANYLMQFESALSAYYGKDYENGYYGTPFVEIDYFSTQIRDSSDDRIVIVDSVNMSGESPLSFGEDTLSNLLYNPIVSLYNDGLRAQDPKSKFLNWFTIIEEYLENNKTLTSKFEPQFSDAEKEEIQEFTKKFGERASSLRENLGRTKFSRHKKLSIILGDIGIASVGRGDQQTSITPETCKMLIDTRHRLFHRGKMISELELYKFLYPLVSRIVMLSASLMNGK